MTSRSVADRYRVLGEIGAGGMATVELGELVGPVGFSRLVAIKRLHPRLSRDPELVTMFVDEARLAARVRHPNVVSTLDVVQDDGELFLVLDYVHGDSLSRLLRASGGSIRPDIAAAIVLGLLHGLHAAHEAVGAGGVPLEIVHRDVSPENVLVGADGVARLADFGVAKARHRLRTTMDGSVRGKLPYMAPEQLTLSGDVDRRTDVYAVSVVLWELLTGRVPLTDRDIGSILAGAPRPPIAPPSQHAHARPLMISEELDAVVLRGMSPASHLRFATAIDMAMALERAQAPASQHALSEWVRDIGGPALDRRDVLIDNLEAVGARDHHHHHHHHDHDRSRQSAPPIGIETAPHADGTLPEEPKKETTDEQEAATQAHPSPEGSGTRRGFPSRKTISIAPTVRMVNAPAHGPMKRRARPPIGFVAACLAALLLFVAIGMGKWTGSRSTAPATAAAIPIDLPPPVESAVVVVVPSPPITVAPPSKTQPKKKMTPPSPPPRPAASSNACQVPFRVDDDGVRIPKPGCW